MLKCDMDLLKGKHMRLSYLNHSDEKAIMQYLNIFSFNWIQQLMKI